MERMTFIEARELDPATATDEQVVAAWHAYACQISYHHADDSGREWGAARGLMPTARLIEKEIRRRNLPRPNGQYLLAICERINWETGEWPVGLQKDAAA